MDLLDTQIYGRIGDEGFDRLTSAFYARVPADEILSVMYDASDLPAARQRLRDFLIGRFGGPQIYTQQRGHPRLRMRHARFHVDRRARDRWIALMRDALEETKLPRDIERMLMVFFEDVATFLINRESFVPPPVV